jgi:hypothetical protein
MLSTPFMGSTHFSITVSRPSPSWHNFQCCRCNKHGPSKVLVSF